MLCPTCVGCPVRGDVVQAAAGGKGDPRREPARIDEPPHAVLERLAQVHHPDAGLRYGPDVAPHLHSRVGVWPCASPSNSSLLAQWQVRLARRRPNPNPNPNLTLSFPSTRCSPGFREVEIRVTSRRKAMLTAEKRGLGRATVWLTHDSRAACSGCLLSLRRKSVG